MTMTVSQQTRMEAYQAFSEEDLAALQGTILARLRELGKAAPWQIGRSFGLSRQDVAPRITELADRGLIMETGERVTDPATGHSGAVWRSVH